MNELTIKGFSAVAEKEIINIDGGETSTNGNNLFTQIYNVIYDFGHDVVYPYIWAPLTGKNGN